MTRPPSLEEARMNLGELRGREVVMHGSALSDLFTPRSDVDVAVVARDADASRNRALWRGIVGSAPDRYDIRVYELLPLPVRVAIARRHEVVFGDRVELSSYFYRDRRTWKDQEPRYRANQFRDLREKREALTRARRSAGQLET